VSKSRSDILEDVLMLLRKLADDWEYSGAITGDTRLIAEMGLESLDVVVLALSTQEHYGQPLPLAELFAEIGERDESDMSVGEWVDFIHLNLSKAGEEDSGSGQHS
jgi:acyl carrier protein